jgi:predicted ATPase
VTDVAVLAAAVQAQRRSLDRLAGRAQQVALAGKAEEAAVARLTAEVDVYAKVAALLTSIGEEAQESARAQFEELATRGLQAVFGEALSFRLVPGESGGQVTLEPVIRSEYGSQVIETPVMDARGGGMAVVVGFVLQLVMILLTPGVRKIIFLDESFAHVPVANRHQLARFLREVAEQAGMQVVMITHDSVYGEYADMQVRFAVGPDGMTRVFDGEVE